MLMRPFLIASATLTLIAGLSAAQGAPIVQLDFNDASGNQSLANRGTASATASFSGNAAFATDAGAPPNGPQSDAGTFDGSDGGANFGDLDALDGSNTATITAWIKLSSSPSDTRRIVSNQDNTDGSREGIEFAITSGDNLQVLRGLNGGSDDAVTSTATISLDTWTFVAGVFSGGKDVDFYTTTTAGAVGTAGSGNMTATNAIQASTEDLYIGRRPGSDQRVFPGDIDNVRIYDSALSASELDAASNFNDAVIPEPASLALLGLGGLTMLSRRRRA